MEELESVIFGIISYSGNAKGLCYEALAASEEGDFETSEKLMNEAENDIREAHKIQTSIIHKEAAGEKIDVGVIFVHSQDHLMTTLSEKALIERMIKQNKRIYDIEQKLK